MDGITWNLKIKRSEEKDIRSYMYATDEHGPTRRRVASASSQPEEAQYRTTREQGMSLLVSRIRRQCQKVLLNLLRWWWYVVKVCITIQTD